MEEEFKEWLRNMYYENCKERAELGDSLYDDVDVYYKENPVWLKRKFNKEMEKK